MTHRLQLFDTPQSLAHTVANFLVDGYNQGDNLLIVAKAQHRNEIFATMSREGCFRDGVHGPQRLVALEAAEVLDRISRVGLIDPQRFDAEIGQLVARLAGSRPLRIYGELVEVLAAEGDFEEAMRLEGLWNRLAKRVPFDLLCGYSSAHFSDPNASQALREICRLHTHAAAALDDNLGSYLLTNA